MKKIIFSIFILSLVFSFSAGAFGEEVKLVDYNVWFGIDGNGTFKMGEYEDANTRALRFDLLTSGLLNLDPDVIGIQEANELPCFAKRLARKIGYDVVWKVGNSGIKIFGFGIPVNFTEGDAVLAKKGYDLKYLGAKRLSGSGIQRDHLSFHTSEVRNAMAALVTINGKKLIVFNTHTHFSLIMDEGWKARIDEMLSAGEITEAERDEMMAEMESSHEWTESDITELSSFVMEITQKYDYPYAIMGDFNTTKESHALTNMIEELSLLDPYEIKNPGADGFTWDPEVNTNTAYDGSPFWADGVTPRDPLSRLEAEFDRETPRRIDFIFLSHHFTTDMIKSARLIFTEAEPAFVSDHFGVEVIVEDIP